MILAIALLLLALRVIYSLAEIYYEHDWPRATFRGLAASVGLVLLCASAFGQANRWDWVAYTVNQSTPQPGGMLPVLALPGSTVQVCATWTSGVAACNSLATSYTDATMGTACPTSAQLTPGTSSTCTNKVDSEGNMGAWLPAGSYAYVVTTAYGTYGPYPFGVDAAGSYCALSGCTLTGPLVLGTSSFIDSNFYSTFAAACSAAVTAKVPLLLSRSWNAIPTQSCAADLLFWSTSGAILQPASGATLTLTGTITAPVTQIFDNTAGGTVTGLSVVEPEWFGSAALNSSVRGALSTSGGTIVLQNSTYSTTYSVTCFTKDDVWIKGAKMPVSNSANTGLTNGTIIQGGFNSCGSNRLKITDVGFDDGSALGTSTNDALAVSGLTGSGADPIVEGPYLENIVAMLSSGSVPLHAIRIEHCNNAYEHNLYAYFGTHGFAIKCTNTIADSLYTFGQNSDGVIVKSDSYTPTAHVKVTNVFASTINSSNVLNIGVIVDSNAYSVNDVQISGVTVTNARGGVSIRGESTTGNGISVKNLILQDTDNTLGITFSGCVTIDGDTAQVNVAVDNVQCLNTAGSGEGMQPINIGPGCNTCQFANFTINGSNSASFLNGDPIIINNWTSVNPTFGYVYQLVGAGTIVFANNLYTTETYLNSGASTSGSQLFTSGVVGPSALNGALGVPNIFTSSGLFNSSITTSVAALSTPTVLAGSGAASGLLRLRDNTSGGSALFLVDPNAGSQLIGTSQITGISSASEVTYSSGNWNVELTSGPVPRIISWTIVD